MVRLGHPARLMDSVLKHSLDYNVMHGEGCKIIAVWIFNEFLLIELGY